MVSCVLFCNLFLFFFAWGGLIAPTLFLLKRLSLFHSVAFVFLSEINLACWCKSVPKFLSRFRWTVSVPQDLARSFLLKIILVILSPSYIDYRLLLSVSTKSFAGIWRIIGVFTISNLLISAHSRSPRFFHQYCVVFSM